MKKIIILIITHSLFLLAGWFLVYFIEDILYSNNEEKFVIPTLSVRVCNATETMINLSLMWADAPNFPEIWAKKCSEYIDSYELFVNQPLMIDTLENNITNRYLYTVIDTMEASNVAPGKYTLTINELTDWSIVIEHQDAIKYEVLRDWDFKSIYDF